jgi:hypothetical protein
VRARSGFLIPILKKSPGTHTGTGTIEFLIASYNSPSYNIAFKTWRNPMVRISKVGEIRSKCPKRRRPPAPKTGSLKDNLPQGFKNHVNAVSGDAAKNFFIPKIG